MSTEPLTREERRDLMEAADEWCDGQPDAPVSRISVAHGYRRAEATVQAAEERAERLLAELLSLWDLADAMRYILVCKRIEKIIAADDAARGEK